MLDLQTIAQAAAATPFSETETADLFAEACALAPANAVRIEPLVRKRLGSPFAVLIHADVRGASYLMSEATAEASISLLCAAAATSECQDHLVSTALEVGAAIAIARGLIANQLRSSH